MSSFPAAEATPDRHSGPTVLVADDDEAMRKLLYFALTRRGFHVQLAADGREAIEVFKRRPNQIDVAVLDVRMPVCNGPQTLAALRQERPGMRAVFVTGFPGDQSEEQLLAQGAARVFYKPFPLPEFTEFVWRLVAPE